MLRNFFKIYSKLLVKNPVKIQAIQTGFLMATGDILSQTVIDDKSTKIFDSVRTLRFFTLGTFTGPVIYYWYRTLERKIGVSMTFRPVILKVACDQLLFAPVFLIGLISIVSFMKTQQFEYVKSNLKDNYLNILITNWKIWPIVQLFNFSVVPFNYRVLFLQTVVLGWNTYLSHKLNKV